MVTTSYFANRRVINKLSISRFSPNWYSGPELKILAPSSKLLRLYKSGQVDAEEYTHIFNKQLSNLDCKDVYNQILSYGKDVSLLCYEKPSDFCHRRLVAMWIEEELRIEVPEFGFGTQGMRKLF